MSLFRFENSQETDFIMIGNMPSSDARFQFSENDQG